MSVTIPLPTERVHKRLRRDIISCTIAPGSETSEAQLCKDYNFGTARKSLLKALARRDGELTERVAGRRSTHRGTWWRLRSPRAGRS